MFNFSRELRQLFWCLLKTRLRSHFSESQTIEDFGAALHLMRTDLEHLRSVFMAVENGDLGMLKSLGIKDSELGDVKFFLEKLVNTGFLDWAAPPPHSSYPKRNAPSLLSYFPLYMYTPLCFIHLIWIILPVCLSLCRPFVAGPQYSYPRHIKSRLMQ